MAEEVRLHVADLLGCGPPFGSRALTWERVSLHAETGLDIAFGRVLREYVFLHALLNYFGELSSALLACRDDVDDLVDGLLKELVEVGVPTPEVVLVSADHYLLNY
jgi:hypothetical protein